MAKGKFDYITFFYKVFIIFLIVTQGYSLLFVVGNWFTLIVNAILMFYLIFRFYLLVNLSKKATKVFMTLPDFLGKCKKYELCDKCKNCEHECAEC